MLRRRSCAVCVRERARNTRLPVRPVAYAVSFALTGHYAPAALAQTPSADLEEGAGDDAPRADIEDDADTTGLDGVGDPE